MTSEFQENYDQIKNKKSGEWEANFVGEDLPGRTAYYNEDIREENLRNEDVLLKSESYKQFLLHRFNRYRRKRPKLDASIFDSALSHTRRSDASEKR